MHQGGIIDAGQAETKPAELDEGGDPGPGRPGEPRLEHLKRPPALDGDDGSELLLEQVGPVEAAVDLTEKGELLRWWAVRSSGFFHK